MKCPYCNSEVKTIKILQHFPCGCCIILETDNSHSISYCPKHKAASEMYEALKLAREALTIKLNMPTYREILEFKNKTEPMILSALAKAEGKE